VAILIWFAQNFSTLVLVWKKHWNAVVDYESNADMELRQILNEDQESETGTSAYHAPIVLTEQKEPSNIRLNSVERLYYSTAFEEFYPLNFYGNLLHKVLIFAQTFDEGTIANRERVWKMLDALVMLKLPRDTDLLFSPPLMTWLRRPVIYLFILELMYISFMFVTSDAYIYGTVPSNHQTSFSPFGSSLPDSMNQLRLLHLWANQLDNLPQQQKVKIWSICRMNPLFPFQEEDVGTFLNTIETWSEDPVTSVPWIRTLFAAVGCLSETGQLEVTLRYTAASTDVLRWSLNKKIMKCKLWILSTNHWKQHVLFMDNQWIPINLKLKIWTY